MSYVVLALKWRPGTFADIVGQPHIVNNLTSALAKDRLAHAYLFAGPRGVGKTSTARILARALNCKKGPIATPCGTCPSCVEIGQGSSLDVIEIDGASNTQVDNVRDLRESVKFAPTSGKFKIYIIDEVHMLSQGAFNALLKTLEEPPPHVKFIFATTHPEKIPATVVSRCHRLDFRRISLVEIIAQLEKIAKAEHITFDQEVLFAIARSSDGSLRDAESILDQLASFSRDAISLEDINAIFGIIGQDVLFAVTDTIIKKDAKAALKLLHRIIDEGKDVGVFLGDLIEHFRNLMIAKVAPNESGLIDLPQDVGKHLLEQARAFSLDEIMTAFNAFVNAREMSKRLDSARIPLEIVLVKLTQDKKATGVSQAQPTIEAPPAQPSKPVREARKTEPEEKKTSEERDEPPEQIAQASFSLEDIKQAWGRLVEMLAPVKMSAATYLNEGEPVGINRNMLTVSFPKDYSLHKEALETKENRSVIEKILADLFPGGRLRVNFILSQEPAEKKETASPEIQAALQMFGGRVIKEE
jgi:DNA polymerase-3 subunit gamma/tau